MPRPGSDWCEFVVFPWIVVVYIEFLFCPKSNSGSHAQFYFSVDEQWAVLTDFNIQLMFHILLTKVLSALLRPMALLFRVPVLSIVYLSITANVYVANVCIYKVADAEIFILKYSA